MSRLLSCSETEDTVIQEAEPNLLGLIFIEIFCYDFGSHHLFLVVSYKLGKWYSSGLSV